MKSIKQQLNLQACLNISVQHFADTRMFIFEDLTSKIAEKSLSRAKTKGMRLKKGRQSDNERVNSESLSESEREIEEQVK